MTTQPTRKTIDAFFARLTAGTRLTCLANTYRDDGPRPAAGTVVTITRPGKTSIDGTVDACAYDGCVGEVFNLRPPTAVRDVLALDGDTITYRIGRDGHAATWRIEAASEPLDAAPCPCCNGHNVEIVSPPTGYERVEPCRICHGSGTAPADLIPEHPPAVVVTTVNRHGEPCSLPFTSPRNAEAFAARLVATGRAATVTKSPASAPDAPAVVVTRSGLQTLLPGHEAPSVARGNAMQRCLF